MLTIDKSVTLNCTDTGKDAAARIVRIQRDRVDVILAGGAEILISLHKTRPGIYVGSQSGLEFVMKT
jgi:hypothetical protein